VDSILNSVKSCVILAVCKLKSISCSESLSIFLICSVTTSLLLAAVVGKVVLIDVVVNSCGIIMFLILFTPMLLMVCVFLLIIDLFTSSVGPHLRLISLLDDVGSLKRNLIE